MIEVGKVYKTADGYPRECIAVRKNVAWLAALYDDGSYGTGYQWDAVTMEPIDLGKDEYKIEEVL